MNSDSKKGVAQDESAVFKTSQIPSFGVKPEPQHGSGAVLGAHSRSKSDIFFPFQFITLEAGFPLPAPLSSNIVTRPSAGSIGRRFALAVFGLRPSTPRYPLQQYSPDSRQLVCRSERGEGAFTAVGSEPMIGHRAIRQSRFQTVSVTLRRWRGLSGSYPR